MLSLDSHLFYNLLYNSIHRLHR